MKDAECGYDANRCGFAVCTQHSAFCILNSAFRMARTEPARGMRDFLPEDVRRRE